MRMGVLLVLGCLTVIQAPAGEAELDAFGRHWLVPVASDWKVVTEEGETVVDLIVPRPSTQPRRPSQYALAKTPDFSRVTVELEVWKEPAAARNRHTSVMLVYAWRDPDHFNYVHLSVDPAAEQPVHNGVFHVYGGDRVRISSTGGPGSLVENRWQKVKLEYDASSHTVQVWVDGKTSPSLKGIDLSLGAGRVGIGSFFDMGRFRRVKITGE